MAWNPVLLTQLSIYPTFSFLGSKMASSEVIFLKDEKIRELARLIRGHEINNLYYIKFRNVGEQQKYLTMVNDNENSVSTILDNCKDLMNRYKDDAVRGPIAGYILVYAENCLNNALQFIRNYTLRRNYLDKLIDHLRQLFQALEDLNTGNQTDVADFKEDVEHYNHRVMSYMRLAANSYASKEFSRYLRNIGIGFHELVRSYQVKLGYSGRFEDLEEAQKIEVYTAIIEASGRLHELEDRSRKVLLQGLKDRSKKVLLHGKKDKSQKVMAAPKKDTFKYGSNIMFIYSVGSIVWDVYSSDHPMTTATREALVQAAKEGGSALGKLVGAAMATELVGVEASALFVTAAGILGGFVGSFIIGAAAGLLFDKIFGSAGATVLPTDGFILYVAPMPNGRDIAKQIANI